MQFSYITDHVMQGFPKVTPQNNEKLYFKIG